MATPAGESGRNEIGWTHSWITATLALRQMKTSLWDLSKDSKISTGFDKIRRRMLPVHTIVPGPKDAASGACNALETWQLGGIGGNWLAVGQPNTLNRDDRAVFRFDIRRYLTAGRVAKATLRLAVDPQTRGETFRLEHFTVERFVLAAKDLGSTQVELVRSFEVKHGTPAGLALSFDVTGAVNRDLEAGFGFSRLPPAERVCRNRRQPDQQPEPDHHRERQPGTRRHALTQAQPGGNHAAT